MSALLAVKSKILSDIIM